MIGTLRLADPAVSRYHAELRPVAGGVAVTDHGSTNGTFAGGVRIDRGVVPVGTQLLDGEVGLPLPVPDVPHGAECALA